MAAPAGFGLLFGAVAVVFWRVSCRATRWPAVWFVLLGGVVSLLGHGVGFRRGLLRVPLLSEASPASGPASG